MPAKHLWCPCLVDDVDVPSVFKDIDSKLAGAE
jgi:hypothetical protein